MDSRAKTWLLYFKIFGFTNHIELDQPLPLEQLQINPDHPVTQRLLSLYSMETLIPSIISNATINKDRSKVQSLGPYCYALLRILQTAEHYRMDINHT